MSHANSIISAPVQMPSDLASVLGISGTSLADACRSSAINKWAKYKPVRYPNINTVPGWDSANNRWGSGAIWWKATDGLCGFSTDVGTEFGTPTDSQAKPWSYKLIHGELGWTYNKPTGGSSAPYRLTDFACYYHDAIAPYGDIGATTIYIDQNGDARIDWEVVDVDSYYNLKLTDIQPGGNSLSDLYLGVILYSGSTWNVYTSSTKFGAGQSLSVVMHNMASKAGTWNLMPFFTKQEYNGSFPATDNIFISMADTQPVSVTLTTQGSNHFNTPEGEWNQAGTAVPAEHLALPNPDDVKEGVIATKIGAYAGDLASGQIDGSQDLAMAEARKNLDWEAQYACAMFPEAARAKRDQRPPEEEDTCTMCGNYCAVKIVNEWLDQSDSDLIK